MKNRVIISVAAIGLLAAIGFPAVNWAQEKSDDPLARKQIEMQEKQLKIQAEEMHAQARVMAKEARKAAENMKFQYSNAFRAIGQPRHLTDIHEQAAKYHDAEDEKDKTAALDHLNEVVDKYFEEDMKVREQELASIEERVKKLKVQLDRRRSKKQEIVDLQVKVAINESEGLGFSSEPQADVIKFRVPAPVVMSPYEGNSWNVGPGAPVPITVPIAVPSPPSPPSTEIRHGIEARSEDATAAAGTSSVDAAPNPFWREAPVPTTAPQAGVIFARQPLRSGVKGDAVRLLQFQLNEHLNPTPALNVDADFGPETEKAVKAFQKMQGLKVTGIVDEDTRKALDRRVKSPAVK